MTETAQVQPELNEPVTPGKVEHSPAQTEGFVEEGRIIMEGISEADSAIVEQGVKEGLEQYADRTAAMRAHAEAVKAKLLSEGTTPDEVRDEALSEAHNLMDGYGVYSDATLAGFKAREKVSSAPDGEAEKSSLEDEALSAYHELLVSCGYSQEDATKVVDETKAAWASQSQQAGTKFFASILPGDIILEHYTPYALGPILDGGLKPKDEHAVTSVNRRSKLVHFTSHGDVPGAWGTDISSYVGVRTQTLRRMDEDPDLTPVSGMFTVPLASLLEKGVKAAHFTPKVIDGKTCINDTVLADGDGKSARIDLDSLHFVPASMSDPNGLLGDRAARLPYDVALNKEIEELASKYTPGEMTWDEFVEKNLDVVAISKRVLIEQGADPAWVNTHVSSKDEARRMAEERSQQLIVPLATAKMENEHVDGKLDTSDQQTAFLGIVQATV